MKKIFFVFFCSVFLFTGCEKKENLELSSGEFEIWTANNVRFWKAVGKEFGSIFSEGDLQVQVIAFESEEELEDTFINALAEGRGPDIIVGEGDFLFHNRAKFVPLTRDEGVSSERYEREFVSAVSPLFLQGQSVWGVPLSVDSLALFFNIEQVEPIFSDLEEKTLSWDELKENISSLTKRDNSFERFSRNGIALGRMDNIRYGAEVLHHLIFQLGGKLFTPEGEETLLLQEGITAEGKKIHFVQKALELFLGFGTEGSPFFAWNAFVADSDSSLKDFERFLEGKVSFVFGFARDIPVLKEGMIEVAKKGKNVISEANIGITFFPQIKKASSLDRVIFGDVQGMAVSRSTRDPDLGWSFLKFMLRKESLIAYARVSGLPSASTEILLEQEAEKNLAVFVRQAKGAQFVQFPFPTREVRESLKSLVDMIQNKKVSVKTALARLEEQFSQQLERLLFLKKQLQE